MKIRKTKNSITSALIVAFAIILASTMTATLAAEQSSKGVYQMETTLPIIS